MVSPWLSIVGIGEDGPDGLGRLARSLIDRAEVLVGGKRHLALIPADGRERLSWPSPLQALLGEIERRRGRRVCVLATGDPMHYGVGVTLARRIPIDEMIIVPAPSAFALACARLGWDRAGVRTLTLHGRPPALLQAHVLPGARLLILSDSAATPGRIAELLCERGYGPSRLTVLEHMGGPCERIFAATARDWPMPEPAVPKPADFNTVAVECVAEPGAALLPAVPGLPDEAFRHDGQLTKREVRAVTLARLAPVPGQLLWDVGAGCGSIAIEWLRAAPGSRAVAVECDPQRLQFAAANAAALGAPQLQPIEGEAPAVLAELPDPDALFIGGGLSADLLEYGWTRLRPGGRLVANAVTLESEAVLLAWQQRRGGELTRLAVSRAGPVGGRRGWRPLMPVTQYTGSKP